jgi:predicted nucleic acid-binding protein
MEVLVGVEADSEEEKIIDAFIQQFKVINLDDEISDLGIKIKRQRKIKLPDAIIWASAEHENALLVTRNTKDFPCSEPFIRVPYHL